jgi:hypothetical protein
MTRARRWPWPTRTRRFSLNCRRWKCTYIEVLDLQTGQQIVTFIELTSPTNKYAGKGRRSYLEKQSEVLGSPSHLVEIDLLRMGQHILAVPEWAAKNKGAYDYLVCVNRARGKRERFELYPRRLAERLPRVRIPLAADDPDAVLDVQGGLNHLYEAARYRYRIDYDAPCVPPLPPEDQAWANQRIIEARQARSNSGNG